MKNLKNDAGFLVLAVRLVIGWTYFSAFWRRTILVNKLDPEVAGYIGEKFNHFLPNALGIKPIIQYLVENPEMLQISMVAFTIIEGIVGLLLIFGAFTRLMSIGVFLLALGILLASGWIGTTCLDEWQIGSLGIATGVILFFTGSGKFSVDRWFQQNANFGTKKWFRWLGSGDLPLTEKSFSYSVMGGTIFAFGMTLFTNQVFHNGIWGKLHNQSIRPKLELSEGKMAQQQLSFEIYRTEGVDVYGAWIIGVELHDERGKVVQTWNAEHLSQLDPKTIFNHYVSKVKQGKHSLIVPLGAKAKVQFPVNNFHTLPKGRYTIKVTDVSGLYWNHDFYFD